MRKVLTLITLSFWSPSLYSSLASDMDRYFKRAGGYSNYTGPQAWKDQASGGFTGGGAFVRPQSRYVQPVTITPPSLSLGCGIDAYSGGLSFISGSEMIKVVRQIGSQIPFFAAQLMLATVSPEINNVIKNIQAIVQKINELGANQCAASQLAAAALFPKQQHASETVCRWMGSDEGLVSDYIKGKHDCSKPGELNRINTQLAGNPKYKNALIGNFNLVYRILKTSPLWETYQELAEFLMSLTGTVVNTLENGVGVSRLKDSLLDHEDSSGVLKQMLYGSTDGTNAKVYKCEDEECLKMSTMSLQIPREKSFMGQVSKIVESLQEKWLADEGALTEGEKAILETTTVPLLKILTINSIRKTELIRLDEATLEIIAKDFLIHYINEIIGFVEKELAYFKGIQFSSEDMDKLRDNIRVVKQTIRTLETRHFETVSRTHALRTQATQEEDRLMRLHMMTE